MGGGEDEEDEEEVEKRKEQHPHFAAGCRRCAANDDCQQVRRSIEEGSEN